DKATWIDIEKPFWWDVPLWLVNGSPDSIGIANNHMYRTGVYPGEAWGKPRDKDKLPGVSGNGLWSQEIYYHILNSGFRIPPSAGSASGVLPNPVGYNRAYVHVGEKMTAGGRGKGWKAGRVFVTNGPLLLATAGKEKPGAVFRSEKKHEVAVDVDVTGNDLIRSIEILQDGVVVKAIKPGKTAWKGQLGKVTFEKSGWMLVRVIADVKHTFRFASTGPWYVEIGKEKATLQRRSAKFLYDWAKE